MSVRAEFRTSTLTDLLTNQMKLHLNSTFISSHMSVCQGFHTTRQVDGDCHLVQKSTF